MYLLFSKDHIMEFVTTYEANRLYRDEVQADVTSMPNSSKPHIVVMGGGGGMPKVAKGISQSIPNATMDMVAGVHDHGGSSAYYRDEYGIGAVGDIGSALTEFAAKDLSKQYETRYGVGASLENVRSTGDNILSILQSTRPDINLEWAAMQLDDTDRLAEEMVDKGTSLYGHTYRNLQLASAAINQQDIGEAAEVGRQLLGIDDRYRFLPNTLHQGAELVMHDYDASGKEIILIGEGVIDEHIIQSPDDVYVELIPGVEINPKVVDSLASADQVILAPGSFYSSIAASLLVKNMPQAMKNMKPGSKIVAITNATHEPVMQTPDLIPFLNKINNYTNLKGIEGRNIDLFIYHDDPSSIPKEANPVLHDAYEAAKLKATGKAIGANIVDTVIDQPQENDAVVRSKVHHNGQAIGKILLKIMPAGAITSADNLPLAA